ncbi:hypothetical protein AAHC03_09755 [Spirometra sp. Aus1]
MVLILGMESNAKKLGVGVVRDGEVLSNPRLTYVTPPGQGFKPTETARHHQSRVVQVVKRTLDEARVTPEELAATAYTKGPGMCGPLQVVAIIARVLAQLWNKPRIGVNYCVAHIEMGRQVTGAKSPIVLYVSGGNTQVIALSGDKYRTPGKTLDIALKNGLQRWAQFTLICSAFTIIVTILSDGELPLTPSPSFMSIIPGRSLLFDRFFYNFVHPGEPITLVFLSFCIITVLS